MAELTEKRIREIVREEIERYKIEMGIKIAEFDSWLQESDKKDEVNQKV